MTWLTVTEYVPLVISTPRSFPHALLITGFVARLTRRMPLVEQKLPTLPVSSEVHVARFLYFCVVFFGSFFFRFCWPLYYLFFDLWILIIPWYLQTRFMLFVISCQYLPGIFISTLSAPIFVPCLHFHKPYISSFFLTFSVVVFLVKSWLILNALLQKACPFPTLNGSSQFPLSSPAGFSKPIGKISLSTLQTKSIVSPLSLHFRQTWCCPKEYPIKIMINIIIIMPSDRGKKKIYIEWKRFIAIWDMNIW